MKVLVSDKLSQDGINKLKNAGLEVDVSTGLSEEELIKIIPQYEALIVRSETKVVPNVIDAAKNLKIIARAGVGVDNINLPFAYSIHRTLRQAHPTGNTFLCNLVSHKPPLSKKINPDFQGSAIIPSDTAFVKINLAGH